MKRLNLILTVGALTLVVNSALTQQPTAETSPATQMQNPAGTQATASASPPTQALPQMADMESMKRMADMCQRMMQKEKAAMPFIIGSSVMFGALLFIALLLLIVLQI